MSHGMSCRSTQTLSCIHGMTCHLLITSCKHPGNREAWKILFPLCTQRLRLLEILFFSSLTKILRKKSFRSSTFLTGWKDEKKTWISLGKCHDLWTRGYLYVTRELFHGRTLHVQLRVCGWSGNKFKSESQSSLLCLWQ